jgi:predicted helicase
VVTSLDKVVLADNIESLEYQINNYGEIFEQKFVQKYLYRPFEEKKIYYKSDLLGRSREKIMKNYFKDNLGLIISKQFGGHQHFITFITNVISDKSSQAFAPYYNHPLYLYPDKNSLTNERTPNLNLEIIKEIEEKLGLKFVNEKEQNSTTFAPIDILDYIYAVLHSPNYRKKYKEFLKIDFPRVPYPTISNFWQLVEFGGKLRALHLLEDASLDNRIIDIKGEAELKITNKLAKKDTVITDNLVTLNLNSEVSIINIPLIAWEFYIGGYQPAQKWLKDRVGRTLSRADLKHYNRIINALCKTDEIMKGIDKLNANS